MRSSCTFEASGAPCDSKSGTSSASARGSRIAPDSRCAPGSAAFSSTATLSCLPAAFCNCASRSAAESPAGPPPTINTSTSSVSRSLISGISGLLELSNHRWHDLEQIANDAIVRDLEDRRIAIFINCDDRAGALHADHMLDRTGNAERHVQLWRNSLPGAAHLTLHRQPAAVANRP